jgi:hypothetical protein
MVWLAVVMAVFWLRIGWMMYERARPVEPRKMAHRPLEEDYMVAIPKFHVYDLASLERYKGQKLWVKAGFRAEYFLFMPSRNLAPASSRVTFQPMEEILVSDVRQLPADKTGYRPIVLIFEKGGILQATIVGFFLMAKNEYQMQLDDLFYLKNPRVIYSHWSSQTWSKIEAHQLEEQMTFAQVSLSIGDGRLITTEAGDAQLYEFDRRPGGREGKIRVRFQHGRVIEIRLPKDWSATIGFCWKQFRVES